MARMQTVAHIIGTDPGEYVTIGCKQCTLLARNLVNMLLLDTNSVHYWHGAW